MNGAREYAELFATSQHGRLYIVSGYHARGKTFRIFVLPEGVKAEPNGPHNAPLNEDAVEVYGVVGGDLGWTESYGWLHKGKWQQDFEKLVAQRKEEIADALQELGRKEADRKAKEEDRKQALLANY
jgi:hypothetical protein